MNISRTTENVTIFIALCIISVVAIWLIVTQHMSDPRVGAEIKTGTILTQEDVIEIDVNGYYESCMNALEVFVRDGEVWTKINNQLPYGNYYLDGTYHGHAMCDVVVCQERVAPTHVRLYNYHKNKDRKHPSVSEAYVADYTSEPLSGEIKIDMTYYSDAKCTDRKVHTVIFER